MNRSVLISLVSVGVLSVWAVQGLVPGAFGQAASAEAPRIGEGGVPQFELVPNWGKVPAKWKLGQSTAVAVDEDNHVWILTVPHILARAEAPNPNYTAAPPVMEFDSAGNFIRAWGGEDGTGYEWPSTEHSLTVDHKGFVWVLGRQQDPDRFLVPANLGLRSDNQILKFTQDGEFVMAIGENGQTGSNATEVLSGAAALRVDPATNQLFVADGYGNSRIMVYDADNGKFKRMWGAYGNRPLDMKDRPPRSKPTENPWVAAVPEVLQQFGTPLHNVAISDDGLVYVADRGNKRVQVFTPDGEFVAEQFIGLDYSKESSDLIKSLDFSPDQRFLYVSGAPVVFILNRRTLEVLGQFEVGSSTKDGHWIAVDDRGDLYLATTGGVGMTTLKYAFKGYSPTTICCQVGGVRAVN